MAFATTNVQKSYLGNLKVTYGDWSALATDAPGTIGVEGGRIWLGEFNVELPNGTTYSPRVNINSSTSGAVTTITVYHQGEVTTGRFLIIHG